MLKNRKRLLLLGMVKPDGTPVDGVGEISALDALIITVRLYVQNKPVLIGLAATPIIALLLATFLSIFNTVTLLRNYR